MSDIESFEKYPNKESVSETTTIIYETSLADTMGLIVSPKKRLIMRSQSQTEATSPNTTVSSDSQKSSLEEENSSQRSTDSTFESIPKQPIIVFANKRSLPSVSSLINEVTSSDPSIGKKRQKIVQQHVPSTNINYGNEIHSDDDPRKQQIRESNREAARRCRERRRNYIEQLEGSLEQHKNQIKQLSDKLMLAERDNTRLHAILTETKVFQSRRTTPNETIRDFSTIIINGNEIDGNFLQRNFPTRCTH